MKESIKVEFTATLWLFEDQSLFNCAGLIITVFMFLIFSVQ